MKMREGSQLTKYRGVPARAILSGQNRRAEILLAGPALENQRGVGAAKSKRIRKRVVHLLFARVIRLIVQIASRVRIKLIDGGGQNLVTQRQHADARLEAACATEQMPRHRFGRTHG